MNIENVKCNICGSDDYEVIWDKTERELDGVLECRCIHDKYGRIINGRIVMCKHCGLVYANPRMTQAGLDEFYSSSAYRDLYGTANPEHNQHAESAWHLLQPYMVEGQRFLDIGCSTGALVELANESLDAYGIEPSRSQCQVAWAKELNVTNCTLEQYTPARPMDIITMLNTLEHMTDPMGALLKIRSLLSDDGYLLVSVPKLGTKYIATSPDAFLSCAHLYHFEMQTIKNLFEKCGFNVQGLWIKDESIGEKIYILGRKTQAAARLPEIPPDYAQRMNNYFTLSSQVWRMKKKIKELGFR